MDYSKQGIDAEGGAGKDEVKDSNHEVIAKQLRSALFAGEVEGSKPSTKED